MREEKRWVEGIPVMRHRGVGGEEGEHQHQDQWGCVCWLFPRTRCIQVGCLAKEAIRCGKREASAENRGFSSIGWASGSRICICWSLLACLPSFAFHFDMSFTRQQITVLNLTYCPRPIWGHGYMIKTDIIHSQMCGDASWGRTLRKKSDGIINVYSWQTHTQFGQATDWLSF